jgi:hypothetical protein
MSIYKHFKSGQNNAFSHLRPYFIRDALHHRLREHRNAGVVDTGLRLPPVLEAA